MKEVHVLRAKNLSSESTATAFTRRMDTVHLVSHMSAAWVWSWERGEGRGKSGTVEEVSEAEKHHFSARELAASC